MGLNKSERICLHGCVTKEVVVEGEDVAVIAVVDTEVVMADTEDEEEDGVAMEDMVVVMAVAMAVIHIERDDSRREAIVILHIYNKKKQKISIIDVTLFF